MPELPEVETTARYLRSHLLGRTIHQFVTSPGSARAFNLPAVQLADLARAARITAIDRVGKWLLFDLTGDSGNFSLIAHLRMSGRFVVHSDETPEAKERHPHLRYHLVLDNGIRVDFVDQRKFGTLHYTLERDQYLRAKNLGPDALATELSAAQLFIDLQKRKKSIYSTLLDQSIIAGLGNIYVNEILHAMQLHPLVAANSLTLAQVEQLLLQTRLILERALAMKGTTLIDNLYQDPEGKSGEFAAMLQVYGKHKDPTVTVLKIGGRSVFTKQPSPRSGLAG